MDERQDGIKHGKTMKEGTAASRERTRREGTFQPDFGDEAMRRREAARQKRREERMRALRIQRAILFGALALVIIVIIFIAVSCARRNDSSKAGSGSTDSGKTSGSSGSVTADGDVSGDDHSQDSSSGQKIPAARMANR